MSHRDEMWRTLRRLVNAGDIENAQKMAARLGFREPDMVARLLEQIWSSVNKEARR